MAIGVNEVYRTVLTILNKEQRGYLTPEEFNKIGSQVQREIFERYFEDLNQELRQPQSDYDYSDRVMNTDGKLEVFKTTATITPTGSNYALPNDFYRLGSVSLTQVNSLPIEIERLNRSDFFLAQRSNLSTPSLSFPVYLFESNNIIVSPETTATIELQYVRKPVDINWTYDVNALGAFVYNSGLAGHQNFELHNSERVKVILNILLYAGVVIRDQSIVSAAAGQLQADLQNAKS